MKKIISILIATSLLTSCGSKPRDPVQASIAAIGAESARREKQKKNNAEFFERLQYQKKRDALDNVARNFGRQQPNRTPRPLPAPEGFNPFGFRPVGN